MTLGGYFYAYLYGIEAYSQEGRGEGRSIHKYMAVQGLAITIIPIIRGYEANRMISDRFIGRKTSLMSTEKGRNRQIAP